MLSISICILRGQMLLLLRRGVDGILLRAGSCLLHEGGPHLGGLGLFAGAFRRHLAFQNARARRLGVKATERFLLLRAVLISVGMVLLKWGAIVNTEMANGFFHSEGRVCLGRKGWLVFFPLDHIRRIIC